MQYTKSPVCVPTSVGPLYVLDPLKEGNCIECSNGMLSAPRLYVFELRLLLSPVDLRAILVQWYPVIRLQNHAVLNLSDPISGGFSSLWSFTHPCADRSTSNFLDPSILCVLWKASRTYTSATSWTISAGWTMESTTFRST